MQELDKDKLATAHAHVLGYCRGLLDSPEGAAVVMSIGMSLIYSALASIEAHTTNVDYYKSVSEHARGAKGSLKRWVRKQIPLIGTLIHYRDLDDIVQISAAKTGAVAMYSVDGAPHAESTQMEMN